MTNKTDKSNTLTGKQRAFVAAYLSNGFNATKAAIKAGDRLSSGEVTALLEQRHHFQGSHHCPHGRPTALVFTHEELDKRFRRT